MKCTTSGCQSQAVFHLTWTEDRRCTREQHLCEPHAKSLLSGWGRPQMGFSGRRVHLHGAKQFEVSLVIVTEIHDQQVIYLNEVGGPRYFPMLTGIFEATSVARMLTGIGTPHPLIHNAMLAGIRLLGGDVQDVLIDRLENQMYFSNARIHHQGRLVLLDLRPSDAIALAILSDAPIFVAESVIELGLADGGIK